jgi:hypothetical protein
MIAWVGKYKIYSFLISAVLATYVWGAYITHKYSQRPIVRVTLYFFYPKLLPPEVADNFKFLEEWTRRPGSYPIEQCLNLAPAVLGIVFRNGFNRIC